MPLDSPHHIESHQPVVARNNEADSGPPTQGQGAAEVHNVLVALEAPIVEKTIRVGEVMRTLQAKGPQLSEQNPVITTIEKNIAIRAAELDTLLALVNERTFAVSEELTATADALKSSCPSFSIEEIVAIITQQEFVRAHPGLKRALSIGGNRVKDHSDGDVTVFTLQVVGIGGCATVKDAFLLKQGKFVSAVVKEPHTFAVDPKDPDLANKMAKVNWFRRGYEVEAMNARLYLQQDIPHMVKPLLVSAYGPEGQLPIVAYEKLSDRQGNARNFGQIFNDNQILISEKLRTFSFAADGLAELHQRGLVHFDFKPENVMAHVPQPTDPESKAVATIIDPGSLHPYQDETRVVFPDKEGDVATVDRKLQFSNQAEWFSMGYTPIHLDVVGLYIAMNQGKDTRVADRYALGASIRRLLYCSRLIPDPNSKNGANETYADWLSLPPDQYPPPVVNSLLTLAAELENMNAPEPVRSLADIANEMRNLADQLGSEIDPLHRQLANKFKFSIKPAL